MKFKTMLTTSALALGLVVGTPAFAQVTEAGAGSADNNTTVRDVVDTLDLLSNNANNANNSSNDQDNDNNGDNRDNGSSIVAFQLLNAVNTNSEMDELVDLDGEDGSETPVGYNSGAAYVRGNAFAAYAGILNNSFNTGINANTQSATNIAAQGTVNFGASTVPAAAGGGDPD